MFGGKCAYCGVDLPEKGWHADHIEPVLRKIKYVPVEGDYYRSHKAVFTGEYRFPENHRSDNYFPSCAKCNIEKGGNSLEGFRSGLEQKVRVLRDNSAAFRHLERYGMVAVLKEKIVFYFETLTEEQNAI
jgi:hypothetical protein